MMPSPNASMTPPRVLLVDDEPDMLEMLHAWLGGMGFDVALALDGHQALSILQQDAFDLVVTDMRMPGLSGLQLLSLIKGLDPAIEVIFLTGQGTIEDAIAALREGCAFDFLQKPLADLNDLNAAIERALSRRQTALKRHTGPPILPRHIEDLSPRETDILSLLAHGTDNKQIAEALNLSEKTIKNHLTRIFEKLKVRNRTQAVLVCQQFSLVAAEGSPLGRSARCIDEPSQRPGGPSERRPPNAGLSSL